MADTQRKYIIQQKIDGGMLTLWPETIGSQIINETNYRLLGKNSFVLGGTYSVPETNPSSLTTGIGNYSTTVNADATLTENITLTLPKATGTIALITDIPDLSFTDGILDGTFTRSTGVIALDPYVSAANGKFSWTEAPAAGATKDLSYSGEFHVSDLDVVGNSKVGGTETVTGISYLNGGINVNSGNFTVSAAGAVYTESSLEVDGATTLDSTLTVSGKTTINNELTTTLSTFKLLEKNLVDGNSYIINVGQGSDSGTTTRLINIGNSITNVVIPGNLIVQGDNFIAETTTVATDDDIIQLRKSLTAAMPQTGYAGLVATKYDGTNDGALVFDNTGTAYVGDVTIQGDGSIVDVSMQKLATREDTPTTSGIAYWDSSTNKFNTNAGLTFTETGSILTLSGQANLNGGIAVDGTAFTVADGSGNTSISGTLDVDNLSSLDGGVNVNDAFVVTTDGKVSGTTFNKVTITQPANGSILTIADGKTLASNVNLTVGASGTYTGDITIRSSNATAKMLTLGDNSTINSLTANHVLIASADDTIGSEAQLQAKRGGTGIGSYAIGDLLYASGVEVLSKLTGNTTTTKKFLVQTGNGSASAAPVWGAIANSDLPESTSVASDIAAYNASNDPDVTSMTYSAVSVNSKGVVTAGAYVLEVGAPGQTTPSAELIFGGLFFKDVSPVA